MRSLLDLWDDNFLTVMPLMLFGSVRWWFSIFISLQEWLQNNIFCGNLDIVVWIILINRLGLQRSRRWLIIRGCELHWRSLVQRMILHQAIIDIVLRGTVNGTPTNKRELIVFNVFLNLLANLFLSRIGIAFACCGATSQVIFLLKHVTKPRIALMHVELLDQFHDILRVGEIEPLLAFDASFL